MRAMFAVAVLLASAFAVAATVAMLSPRQATRPAAIALSSLAALPDGTPVRVTSSFLSGLDLKAARARQTDFGKPRGVVKELPVFLVRHGDEVRAFIGVDPRSGCDIKYFTARALPWGSFPPMLYDVCHGSNYDFFGQKTGGPTPWNLDELVLTIRDGVVYADTTHVIPGRWVAG
ncbi:MAG TPA: hypothetical protein VEU77_00180 [Candidatus Acidoferrales bacterium]|nr:hypothetical protein [Candidatus Acidoferrales bacterium]